MSYTLLGKCHEVDPKQNDLTMARSLRTERVHVAMCFDELWYEVKYKSNFVIAGFPRKLFW